MIMMTNDIDILKYGDQIAHQLLLVAKSDGLPYDELFKASVIALYLLKSIYSDPMRLFSLLQEAEGEIELLVNPIGSA